MMKLKISGLYPSGIYKFFYLSGKELKSVVEISQDYNKTK